jgi:NAD(P)-dependent dehydrogenase (short-subunit alcohol dehydrogenase family)
MDLKLTGKTALITGASQGIGEHVAETFAAEGVNLHLTARNTSALEDLRARITSAHPVTVMLHPADLTQPGACEALSEAVGNVDILVNNAGAIPSGTLWDVDEAKWRAGWDLKVMGYINLCRLFYPKMKTQGGGVIINNIGNSGDVFDPAYIAGTTGNASLMAFTKALGGSSLTDNIRVVGVNPGPVDTDRIYNMLKFRAGKQLGDTARYKELEATYPLGRPAHRHEISDLIVFLASFRSGYTTGTIITVDGGITTRRSII